MNDSTNSSLFRLPISTSSPHFCLHVRSPIVIYLLSLSLGHQAQHAKLIELTIVQTCSSQSGKQRVLSPPLTHYILSIRHRPASVHTGSDPFSPHSHHFLILQIHPHKLPGVIPAPLCSSYFTGQPGQR